MVGPQTLCDCVVSSCFVKLGLIEAECDEFCQSVLRAHQEDGVLDKCEIESDVVKYQPHGEDEKPALVVAGFPC